MKRRELLKTTAQALAGYTILTPSLLRSAEASTRWPLRSLALSLSGHEGLLLTPADRSFATYNNNYNKRVAKTPEIRFLAKSAEGVAKTVLWAKENGVPFAIRGGGHSYEGFSTNDNLIIDLRGMQKIDFDPSRQRLDVDAGCALGDVYQKIAPFSQAIPAGTCPTVGIAGHALGGGIGMLLRPFGLACDALEEVEIVTADGKIERASETINKNLFWALRGAGQGGFGVVTRLVFKTNDVKRVHRFRLTWRVQPKDATTLMTTWQNWGPNAPRNIMSLFKFHHHGASKSLSVTMQGQSTGSMTELKAEIAKFRKSYPGIRPRSANFYEGNFFDSVLQWSGKSKAFRQDPKKLMEYPSQYMKGKSDMVSTPISQEGVYRLMQTVKSLPPGHAVVMCDAYGGAVRDFSATETAFPHRNALYGIQWGAYWSSHSISPTRVRNLTRAYDSVRPYLRGNGAYVNYCDVDREDWARSYWGVNLPRLQRVKQDYDPENVFNHPQSVPMGGVDVAPAACLATRALALNLTHPQGSSLVDPVSAEMKLDGDMLEVFFRVKTPKIYAPKNPTPDQKPYMFDVVELFLNPLGSSDGYPYYEFELSPYGHVYEVQVNNRRDRKYGIRIDGVEYHAQIIDDRRWEGKMRIPLTRLGWDGDPNSLKGNLHGIFGRKGDSKYNRTYWSLNPHPLANRPNFHQPQHFVPLFSEDHC